MTLNEAKADVPNHAVPPMTPGGSGSESVPTVSCCLQRGRRDRQATLTSAPGLKRTGLTAPVRFLLTASGDV